jgi:hypothetical protein
MIRHDGFMYIVVRFEQVPSKVFENFYLVGSLELVC